MHVNYLNIIEFISLINDCEVAKSNKSLIQGQCHRKELQSGQTLQQLPIHQ